MMPTRRACMISELSLETESSLGLHDLDLGENLCRLLLTRPGG